MRIERQLIGDRSDDGSAGEYGQCSDTTSLVASNSSSSTGARTSSSSSRSAEFGTGSHCDCCRRSSMPKDAGSPGEGRAPIWPMPTMPEAGALQCRCRAS